MGQEHLHAISMDGLRPKHEEFCGPVGAFILDKSWLIPWLILALKEVTHVHCHGGKMEWNELVSKLSFLVQRCSIRSALFLCCGHLGC